jgi:hypothetical protein
LSNPGNGDRGFDVSPAIEQRLNDLMSTHKAALCSIVRSLCIPALAVLGCASSMRAGSSLVSESPFAPPGATAAQASGQGESFELAGSSVQGSDVTVCIFERQKKHSVWIPVGGDVDGVHVISYNALNDTAVVTISGSRKELSMRKAAIASMNPIQSGRAPLFAAAPPDMAPIAAAPNQLAAPVVQDQREARMLVSDLLEIGVQQRKAYQDAKMRAAQGTPPSQ